eukprot:TRINITY_DN1055_c0_g1_i2.p2 TRINITY_DN1055_c0_g1~~TRINITY_DN1055_c0_g1_i2.p2  ORF type:complete len:1006 (+),score=166.16 TRINITY_DN1055_c0_g1_i2:6008-9025(+)
MTMCLIGHLQSHPRNPLLHPKDLQEEVIALFLYGLQIADPSSSLGWNESGQTSTEKYEERKKEGDSDMIVIKSNQGSKKTTKSGFAKSNIAVFGSESEADASNTGGKTEEKSEAKKEPEGESSILTLKIDDQKSRVESAKGEIKSAGAALKAVAEEKKEHIAENEHEEQKAQKKDNNLNVEEIIQPQTTLKDLFAIQGNKITNYKIEQELRRKRRTSKFLSKRRTLEQAPNLIPEQQKGKRTKEGLYHFLTLSYTAIRVYIMYILCVTVRRMLILKIGQQMENNELPALAPTENPVPLTTEIGQKISNTVPNKDFEKRYLEHIKTLASKKAKEMEDAKEEKRKMEESREKVRKIVLTRAEKARKGSAHLKNTEKGKIGKCFRSHYATLLDKPKGEIAEKLPEIIRQSRTQKDNNKSLLEERKKMPKEMADKLRLRQEKYLQQIAEKKIAEKRKQEEIKEKKERVAKKLAEEAKLQMEKVGVKVDIADCKVQQPKSTEKPRVSSQEVQKQHEDFIARNIIQKKCDLTGITDITLWKKKQKLDESTKVFIIMGGYPDIKRALKKRGWVENKQKRSVCFDLKWTLKAKHIDYSGLLENQIVNHFEKNTLITTKAGLCRNLRNLIWYSNVDIDTFYPRCFDLADPAELADFKEEFKTLKAECILKEFIRSGAKISTIGEERLVIALNICEKRLRDIDDILDEPSPDLALVAEEEWEILGNDELSPEALAKKKHEAWFKRLMRKFDPSKGIKKKPKKKQTKTKEEDKKPKEIEGCEPTQESATLKTRIIAVLEELRNKYPQFELNGSRNIWIVKPAGMSRGRGIRIFNNLAEIMDYSQCREQQFIVQKYIENPMIILNRKYDIRQWVLITGWNSITIWFYTDCYVRFGAVEYDIKEITNRYMHLTNNCVTKHCEHVDNEIEGNMWDKDEYSEYLKKQYGKDMFEEKIQPMMKKIVMWSLECVQDNMINRRRSCELLGYDFMIDDQCNPWLIEINSSPAMDYSTVLQHQIN